MFSHITPTVPVAPWLGGKRNLAKRICAIIDATPSLTYAKPFVGMDGIFLRRSTQPGAAISPTCSASSSATIRSSWTACASN